MRVWKDKVGEHKLSPVTVAEYTSPRDFLSAYKVGKSLDKYNTDVTSATDWLGGTADYFERGMTGYVSDYVRAARDLVAEFSNVAVRELALTTEANMINGVLDYTVAMAGNPMCMYGAVIDETDRSPVDLYVDLWVQGDIAAPTISFRGAAILALVQTLSLYRPVSTFIVKGSQFSPKSADTIQTLQIPTSPMDLSVASFMLCSPTVNRHGFLTAINAVHESKSHCGSPPMSISKWQANEMGGWMADRRGVRDYLYFARMDGSGPVNWSSQRDTLAWMKAQLHRFVR